MPGTKPINRRVMVRSSLFGLLAVQMPFLAYAKDIQPAEKAFFKKDLYHRYPAIEDDLVSEVVGASHFDFKRIRDLVGNRPELSRATWDWGFGDWESAIGAASHVGRKDIATYLIAKGARPTLFTFAMLGAYNHVKEAINFYPGIQKNDGPHGFSLLHHAEVGLKENTGNKREAQKLVDFLKKLGDADGRKYQNLKEEDKAKYLGDYRYGDGANDGFSIRLNMRKLLSLGKIGSFGGALYKIGENKFTYNGAPSVTVTFEEKDNAITGLVVEEPGLVLKAAKVN
ncbi:MAG: hypothetical protein KDC24_01770 [Saprospiraceae bacterium]|nr:hypothetical protein [Saprospiraceae bacterium]